MITRGNILLGLLLLGQLAALTYLNSREKPLTGADLGILLPGLDVDNVARLKIADSGDKGVSVTLERGDQGWVVFEHHGYRADQDKVTRTLRELAALTVSEQVGGRQHQVKLKVAEGEFEKRVELTTDKGTQVVYLGTSAHAGSLHARRGDEEKVLAVRDYSTWRLAAAPGDWIDHVYLHLKEEEIAAVTFDRPDGTIQLQQSGAQWLYDAGHGLMLADLQTTRDLLRDLTQLRISGVAGTLEEQAQNLASPLLTVTINRQQAPETKGAESVDGGPAGFGGAPVKAATGEHETITLRIAAKPGEKDNYLVHLSGEAHVGEVGRWSVEKLLEFKAEELETKRDAGSPD